MRHTEFSTHRPHKRLALEPPERAHVMCSGASHGKKEKIFKFYFFILYETTTKNVMLIRVSVCVVHHSCRLATKIVPIIIMGCYILIYILARLAILLQQHE